MIFQFSKNDKIFYISWNTIFTDYWKVLVLNFLEIGNTVFSSIKKLLERSYLLGVSELSMIFQAFGNMVFRAVLSLLQSARWAEKYTNDK